MTPNGKRKVFVAMSGGVDSSVAAYLLRQDGYQVTGVYMKNWSEESFGGKFSKYCPWKKDLEDVRKVCKLLKIPLRVYNFEQEYRKEIIDQFFYNQRRGLTPNPDILCNREIKFGLFLKRALTEGADYIATGHYARKIVHRAAHGTAKFFLSTASDRRKDQTYFLCLLSPRQISKALFPLGNYKKRQIRKIAKNLNFPNATKPESMGICFVGEVPMIDFLKTAVKERPGDIVTSEQKKLGKHIGLPFYTIGQRKGLRLAGSKPWFVVEKDIRKNRLVVAAGPGNKELYKKSLAVKKLNLLVPLERILRKKILVRTRHRQPLQEARLIMLKGRFRVNFRSLQRAITPGQYCAFYQSDHLVGGGEIAQAGNRGT
ncbi:MAG: tRNA 2-thiouridine(34) synthase MnmA [Candidatus Doudnabacteria bacterium]|nr:tRNA 2-thiouridine(34) synthase MnmA [Candidatus Doudnabacteria bacterium]